MVDISGLGVGTAPKAMMAHGIQTDIVEIDPAVHELAIRYFDLGKNHTPIIEDAVTWTKKAVAMGVKYDYILHDVFTGGTEPLPLFTKDFLIDLRSLISSEGVIAINYAGDLAISPTRTVLNTIRVVFNNKCRIYRDLPSDRESGGFTNMVIFCLNPTSNPRVPLKFRRPVQNDFLNSQSRKQFLLPKEELALDFPTRQEMEQEEEKLLTSENMGSFREQQLISARRHWEIMRKVIPAVVWENW